MVLPLRWGGTVGIPFIDPYAIAFIVWVLPPLAFSFAVRASLAPFRWNFLRSLPLALPLRRRGRFFAIALGLFGGRILFPLFLVAVILRRRRRSRRDGFLLRQRIFSGGWLLRLVFYRWRDWSRRGLGPAWSNQSMIASSAPPIWREGLCASFGLENAIVGLCAVGVSGAQLFSFTEPPPEPNRPCQSRGCSGLKPFFSFFLIPRDHPAPNPAARGQRPSSPSADWRRGRSPASRRALSAPRCASKSRR